MLKYDVQLGQNCESLTAPKTSLATPTVKQVHVHTYWMLEWKDEWKNNVHCWLLIKLRQLRS